ncbi:biopolymer transporter ExbD [Aquisalimonas sp.]|uniref:ExbD/TolR family protein n=1 Tax=Aquisalimonas sp. TaxID=1872621 RepID=UPI0025C216F6|nr:biopolymer transporter ExbD [Aquisalimonas sp.]
MNPATLQSHTLWATKPTRRRRRRSIIKLAPLIDVVFILLVFFMLATSYLDWRVIPLHTPAQGAVAAPLEGALLVEVRPDGFRLSGEMVAPDELIARIAQAVKGAPERRVLVRPADDVPLQQSVAALDLLEAAGARNVSLIASLEVQ